VVEAPVTAGGLRPRLVVVWVLLLGLVGAIVVIDRPDLIGLMPGGSSRDVSRDRMLLPVPVDALGAIELAHAGVLHRFDRDPAGLWFYHVHGPGTGPEATHTHQIDPALAERIQAALATFGRAQIERQLSVDGQATEYGVTTPELIILVYRPNEPRPLAQYSVGDVAPDRLSRYVQVVGSGAVVTIPNYQVDNLLALIRAVGGDPVEVR
jgi:hypothetical protein